MRYWISSLAFPKVSYQRFFIGPSFYGGKTRNTCCHYPKVIGVPSKLVSFSSSSTGISSEERSGTTASIHVLRVVFGVERRADTGRHPGERS